MAKARTLDRRRKSIRGIRKITRTMELIATARFRRAMDRATAATSYTERITNLVRSLARSGLEVSHPLLEPRQTIRRVALLMLSANRGLCGGYNSSVFRLAYARYRELKATVPQVQLEVCGKRGISALKFRGVTPDESYTHFEDLPKLEDVGVLSARYLDQFERGQLDRLDVVYTKFFSASRQEAVVETLLPVDELEGLDEEEDQEEQPFPTEYEFLPSAKSILDEVVPASFKVKLFKCFLDAAVSEQIARMIAMKAATENADQMVSDLSMAYNRARQGQITSELLEIIGGADALEN